MCPPLQANFNKGSPPLQVELMIITIMMADARFLRYLFTRLVYFGETLVVVTLVGKDPKGVNKSGMVCMGLNLGRCMALGGPVWAPCMVSKDHGLLGRTLNPPCYVCKLCMRVKESLRKLSF